MKRKPIILVVLLTVLSLLVAAGPVAGQPPHAITVSGHECAYLSEAGEESVLGGDVVHVKDLIAVADYVSDDPTVLPNGTTTSVIDIRINWPKLHFHRTFTLVPDGVAGTFEGHAVGQATFYPDGTVDANVSGVLQGTGEFEGLSMHLVFGPGDFSRCEEGAWDTAFWTGFIVPSGK